MTHPLGKESVLYLGISDLGYCVDHRNDKDGHNYSNPNLNRHDLADYMAAAWEVCKSGRTLRIVNGIPEEEIIFRSLTLRKLPDREFERFASDDGLDKV